MPNDVRPLEFDPANREEQEDMEFFQAAVDRGERSNSDLPPPRDGQSRLGNGPAFETNERYELIEKNGRPREGVFLHKHERQRLDETGAHQESTGRIHESSFGRLIKTPGEAGALCQHKRFLWRICGTMIHKDDLNGTTCSICKISLCRKHAHFSPDGRAFCRRHRRQGMNLQARRPDFEPRGGPPRQRPVLNLARRIIRDSFTLPAADER